MLLPPSVQGVVKEVLGIYKNREPDFMGVYFPVVTARGYPLYGDVFDLTAVQADALLPLMAESIRHFWRLDGRERNRSVNLLTREPMDSEHVSYYAKKALTWTEALRTLCSTFGLQSPV
jgi:hypothetical protein